MKANRRMLDLYRPLHVIASGTGTAVFRITLRRSTGAQVEADDPEGAKPVGDSQNERTPFDLFAFALSPTEATEAVHRFRSHYPPLGPALDRLSQTGQDVVDADGRTPGHGSGEGLGTD